MNTTANTSKLMYSTPEAMLQDLARGANIRAVIPTQLPRVNRRLSWPKAANRPLIVAGAVAILIGLVKPAWLGYVIGGVAVIVCVVFIGIFALGFIGSLLTVLLGLLSLPFVWLKGIRNRPNAVFFTDSDLIVVSGVHFQKHAQKHSFDHVHRLPLDTIQSCRRTPNDLTISAGDHDVTIAGVPGFVSGTAKTNVPDTRYYTDKVVPFDQFESLVSPDSSQDKGVLVTTTTFRHRNLNGDQAPSAAIGGEASRQSLAYKLGKWFGGNRRG